MKTNCKLFCAWNNSISRNIRSVVKNAGAKPLLLFDEELKTKVKQFLLELVTAPADRLPASIFTQSLDIVRVFVKMDFPQNWPEISEYIFNVLDNITANLEGLSKDMENWFRFCEFYIEILLEQETKRIAPSRAHFAKMVKTHLVKIYPLWEHAQIRDWTIDNYSQYTAKDDNSFKLSKYLNK